MSAEGLFSLLFLAGECVCAFEESRESKAGVHNGRGAAHK